MEKQRIYEELLNLTSIEVLDVEIEKRVIVIKCQTKNHEDNCPICREKTNTVNGYYFRTIRDLNMGNRHVSLLVKTRQFHCKKCNRLFMETLDFADSNKGYTHRQTNFMFCLAKKQPHTEVAAIVDTSPKTVERVVLDYSTKTANIKQRYQQVRKLGIDEQSHRKGKKDYICILTDLERGIIIDILPDRKKATLIAHFQSLGEDFCRQITDVSCDYWDAYISVAKTCFPLAKIVLDRFHVIKLLNNILNDFRKTLRKSDPKNDNYKRIKGLLFKQFHTLSDEQLDDLLLAFDKSPLLEKIYKIKERFNYILDYSHSVEDALIAFNNWVEYITKSKITLFDGFIKTLKNTQQYIANYVESSISNAVTEGLNNLIRSVRRIAFEMPNFKHLRLRVLAISC